MGPVPKRYSIRNRSYSSVSVLLIVLFCNIGLPHAATGSRLLLGPGEPKRDYTDTLSLLLNAFPSDSSPNSQSLRFQDLIKIGLLQNKRQAWSMQGDQRCQNMATRSIPNAPYASFKVTDSCLVLYSAPNCDQDKSHLVKQVLFNGNADLGSSCLETTPPQPATRHKKSTPPFEPYQDVVVHTSRLPPETESESTHLKTSRLPERSTESRSTTVPSLPSSLSSTEIPEYDIPELNFGRDFPDTSRQQPEFLFPDTYTPVDVHPNPNPNDTRPPVPIQPCHTKCKTIDEYGTAHEACPGEIELTPCPFGTGSPGNVAFSCNVTEGSEPLGRLDFSTCVSSWISDFERSNQTIPMVRIQALNHFEAMVKTNPEGGAPAYFGHEIKELLSLIGRVIEHKEPGQEQDRNQTEKLAEASVSFFGSLVSEPRTWEQLPEVQRAATTTQLLDTIDSTMLSLAKAGEGSNGTGSYQKTFEASKDFKVIVGTLKRSESAEDQVIGADSGLKLPKGWTSMIPGPPDEDVQYVEITMGPKLVNNMIPRDKGPALQKCSQRQSRSSQRAINSQLSSFTVGNSNGAVSLNFTGPGVRIKFQHAAEAWGSEETAAVPRRLHSDEEPKTVLGTAACVYWDTKALNWSSQGCVLVESHRKYSVCECQHLTAFAVLMSPHQYTCKDIGLTILTILLCSLSTICLVATIIILSSLRTVRNPRSSITIHLCACLLVGNVLILTLMDRNNFSLSDGFCAFTGMVTHYVFLAAFGWMAVEGFVVYKMVVDVFDSGTENKVKLRIAAYGVPCLIVLGVLITHLASSSPAYGGDLYCWLEGAYIWTFIVPVFLVTLGNVSVLAVALKKAYHKSNSTAQVKQSGKHSRNMIIGTLSLTCLLGITWIFGLLLTSGNPGVSVTGAYLFTLFNASQGIFIFFFHCWMNKQVRRALGQQISSWTSYGGSHPSSNTRSQPQQSSLYSARKKSDTTSQTHTSGGSRRESSTKNNENEISSNPSNLENLNTEA